MKGEAVIEGYLVKITQVDTHKSARLIIDIPQEQAMAALLAFGQWPTGSEPLRVAIARLDPNAKPEKPKGGKLAQRAGIVCEEGAFITFLSEKYPLRLGIGIVPLVREICGVESRVELDHDELAALKFNELLSQYKAWLTVGA